MTSLNVSPSENKDDYYYFFFFFWPEDKIEKINACPGLGNM